jgi:hypothetical protein
MSNSDDVSLAPDFCSGNLVARGTRRAQPTATPTTIIAVQIPVPLLLMYDAAGVFSGQCFPCARRMDLVRVWGAKLVWRRSIDRTDSWCLWVGGAEGRKSRVRGCRRLDMKKQVKDGQWRLSGKLGGAECSNLERKGR